MSAFRFTDEEWRAYQQVPDQGYSHRAFLERIVNERLASRPVTDAEADAAQTAFHEYVVGADEPLTERDLRMGRQAWKVALEAARALADKETP